MVFLNDIGTFTQFGRFPIIDNLQLAWPPYGTFYTLINIDIFLPIFPLLLLLLHLLLLCEECKQHLFNFWRDSRLICIWPLHFMLFDLPRCMMMPVLVKGTWRVADM